MWCTVIDNVRKSYPEAPYCKPIPLFRAYVRSLAHWLMICSQVHIWNVLELYFYSFGATKPPAHSLSHEVSQWLMENIVIVYLITCSQSGDCLFSIHYWMVCRVTGHSLVTDYNSWPPHHKYLIYLPLSFLPGDTTPPWSTQTSWDFHGKTDTLVYKVCSINST